MRRPNFTHCGQTYMSNPSLISRYNYTGSVLKIPSNPLTQITYEGCKAVCGSGNAYYPWDEISATVTTWVLPILGALLQAPFESNAFWRTFKAVNRWIGSPISSLACILWDVQISGKCAMFVDMAVPYNETPDVNSEFASMRDSFYILMNLNQYKMKPVISMTREAEGLLRIVLFSKGLKLVGRKKTLSQMRYRLAEDLRSNRRRGVVPIFISTLWFLFALGISIEAAFGDVGSNIQAHNLAMGLFISWLPILILCSIIDRNPIASDDVQRKLNKLVDAVCDSLLHGDNRIDFIASFRDIPEAQQMAYWVEKIAARAEVIKGNYFCGFSGQARTRFHYGAAYAILSDIEKAYISEHGRGWLDNPREARAALVLGQVDRGFTWLYVSSYSTIHHPLKPASDGRQFWQVLCSIFLVGGTSAGAFVLSYNTPTVGLGCRTGGYLIFLVVALVLLLAEIAVWWGTSPLRKHEQFHERLEQYTRRLASRHHRPKHTSLPGLASSKSTLSYMLGMIESAVTQLAMFPLRILPSKSKKKKLEATRARLKDHFATLQNLTTRNWLQRAFFTPLECFNMAWACYLIFAQTIGAFNNCACMTSTWAGVGGYLDFTQFNIANGSLVEKYWIQGTAITCVVMGLGMGYIVLEWLMQAHLSTEDYNDAMAGLRHVRRFRRFTYWVRYASSLLASFMAKMLGACQIRRDRDTRVLVWSKERTYQPAVGQTIVKLANNVQHLPFYEVDRDAHGEAI
ncbi:hypothetical protein HBI37_235460 [Parastagonospora nodorum]|nr:hypothetical protein HBH96_136050 [Parastagonospora nodorum]KAH5381670.1 hypothetical protein HBI33_140140 [Parastagonospora nodorum]KAH6322168.1 hypothetical protein HBI37_235460 [Parastagonospora nodorum]KAH6352719.1 hypothetical protein HBI36_108460 [Parastagonospora nodorum]